MTDRHGAVHGLTRRGLLHGALGVGAVAAVGVGVGVAVGADRPVPGSDAVRSQPRRHRFGMLQAEPEQFRELRDAGVTSVDVAAHWDRLQPAPGRLAQGAVDQVLRAGDAATTLGLGVALTPGWQYPPRWLFDRAGAARFVDQHGTAWVGGAGDDVPDAVFDPRVRDAQEDYVRRLTAGLDGLPLEAVRLGGLARGELHYPFPDADSDGTTLWAYSEPAVRRSPLPGYRPAAGTEEDAAAVLEWYLDELSRYGRWQADLLRDTVGDGPALLVLLPSWGMRPGEARAAARGRLDGASTGEQRGTVTEGLDWERQLAHLAEVPGTAVCTTWLDPPDQGDDVGLTSPGRYLAALAADRLPVWGENTGGNDVTDLRRCLRRSRDLDLAGVYWMGARDLGADGNATLADIARALTAASG